MLFVDRRDDPSIERLADTICDLHQQGLEILVATDPAAGTIGLRPELRRECLTEVGVVYAANGVDRVAWEYPLVQASAAGLHESAALAAYRIAQGRAIAARDGDTMSLVWGVMQPTLANNGIQPAQLIVDADNEPVCEIHHTERPLRALVLWFASSKPACAFSHTLRAYQLRAPDAAQEKYLRDSIAGRVVFYGTDLAGTGDIINSPLHDKIPGVYLHAMAYDNLVTYGDNWKRHVAFSLDNPGYLLQMALMIALSTWLIALLRHSPLEGIIDEQWRKSRSANPKPCPFPCAVKNSMRRFWYWTLGMLGSIFVFLGSAAIALLVVAIGHRLLDLGVLSYIEVVAAALVAEFADAGKRFHHILLGDKESEIIHKCECH